MAQPAEPLGIYVVRGPATQLERFRAELKDWKGGEFLDRLSSKTEHRYWAYPTRSARDARMFIFGSIEHGLRIDIEEYDQATYYPKERALLDSIVATCRVQDPFQVRPNRTLLVQPKPQIRLEGVDCILTELKKANFQDVMPIYFVGSEVRGERD